MLAMIQGVIGRLQLSAPDQATLLFLAQRTRAADAAAKTFCRRDLEAADYEEFFDAGCREYVLGQYPVSLLSGTSVDDPDFDYGVWSDSSRLWGASTLLVPDADYRLRKAGSAGIIRMVRSWRGGLGWGAGEDSVRAHYRAGYEPDAVPADLREAVEKLAALEYLARASGGAGGSAVTGEKKAERWGVYQVSYMTPSEMLTGSTTSANTPKEVMEVRSLLTPYRDWSRGE